MHVHLNLCSTVTQQPATSKHSKQLLSRAFNQRILKTFTELSIKMACRRPTLTNYLSKRLRSVEAPAARYVSPTSELGGMNHKVSRLEQHMLVWNGRYRHLGDVPSFVSRDVMERARDFFRIRLNMSIFAATIFVSLATVISGKNAAIRGESLQKQNLDWHRVYNEFHADI